MRLALLFVLVSAGCIALGVFLKANLFEVVFGLAVGGGVSGGLLYLIGYLKNKGLAHPDQE